MLVKGLQMQLLKDLVNKLRRIISTNKGITIVLFISIVLHFLVFFQLGASYNLNSDDLSYVDSGIVFANTGEFVFRGCHSAQTMPGMTYIISLFSLIFGESTNLWITLKIFWFIMGWGSIIGVYKIVKLFSSQKFAVLAASLFLVIDFVWMDNLILTETPFILAFIFLIYNTFKLAREKSNINYIGIVFWYMFAVLLRPEIAPYPVFMVVYLLFKKYDWRLLLKQGVIAAFVVALFFIPWTIRNYNLYHKLIPLTYGVGNPLLLGTYQGWGYPEDDENAYYNYTNKNMNDEMKSYIYKTVDKDNYSAELASYYSLEHDALIAKYRMGIWFEENPTKMLASYFVWKPFQLVRNTFYWNEVLNIKRTWILFFRNIEILIFAICTLIVFIEKTYRKELYFILFNYLFQVAVKSYTFAFDRYGQALIFFRFIIIGIGIAIIFKYFKIWEKN